MKREILQFYENHTITIESFVTPFLVIILLYKENEIKNQVHGTTTVGLVCSDGIVLTTDTRASMGYYIASRTVNKIAVIDNHCALTIAGGVADAQYVVDQLKYQSNIYKLEKFNRICC